MEMNKELRAAGRSLYLASIAMAERSETSFHARSGYGYWPLAQDCGIAEQAEQREESGLQHVPSQPTPQPTYGGAALGNPVYGIHVGAPVASPSQWSSNALEFTVDIPFPPSLALQTRSQFETYVVYGLTTIGWMVATIFVSIMFGISARLTWPPPTGVVKWTPFFILSILFNLNLVAGFFPSLFELPALWLFKEARAAVKVVYILLSLALAATLQSGTSSIVWALILFFLIQEVCQLKGLNVQVSSFPHFFLPTVQGPQLAYHVVPEPPGTFGHDLNHLQG